MIKNTKQKPMFILSVHGHNRNSRRFQNVSAPQNQQHSQHQLCCCCFYDKRRDFHAGKNDVGNRHSPTVIAAAITSRREKAKLPTHIDVQAATCGLTKDSIVLLEQIRTLDKRRLKDRMGELDEPSMTRVDHALQVSFGLPL